MTISGHLWAPVMSPGPASGLCSVWSHPVRGGSPAVTQIVFAQFADGPRTSVYAGQHEPDPDAR
jgi:hypothetical protein